MAENTSFGSAGATRNPQPALTRREARVRRVLLRELERMNDWKRLTYTEKQHLEKHLDADWLDREMARMRTQLRNTRRVTVVVAPVVAAMIIFGIVMLMNGEFTFALLNVFFSPLYLLGPIFAGKAIQRKLFIYEALRELSDADEMDVMLDRSLRDADELIRRVVESELEIETRFPLRVLNTN